MKTKLLIGKVITCCLSGIVIWIGQNKAYAQVTIGCGEKPVKAALLQLKDQDPVFDSLGNLLSNVTSKSGGLLLPRVMLNDPESLEPLVSDTEANANNGELKLLLVGLMVYNTKVTANKLEAALYVWDGIEWAQMVYLEN